MTGAAHRPRLPGLGDPPADGAEDRPAGARYAIQLSVKQHATMGGVLVLSIAVSTCNGRLVEPLRVGGHGRVTFGFGAIGWVDDWRKVVERTRGMRSLQVLLAILIGLVAAIYLAFSVSRVQHVSEAVSSAG